MELHLPKPVCPFPVELCISREVRHGCVTAKCGNKFDHSFCTLGHYVVQDVLPRCAAKDPRGHSDQYGVSCRCLWARAVFPTRERLVILEYSTQAPYPRNRVSADTLGPCTTVLQGLVDSSLTQSCRPWFTSGTLTSYIRHVTSLGTGRPRVRHYT